MNREAYREEFDSIARTQGIDDSGYYDALLAIGELTIEELAVVERVVGKDVLTIGVGGAQGSGKSTVAELLGKVLFEVFDLSARVLSLDDFYKTKPDRQKMAAEVHPLFAVRGVPGTHDMKLMNSVIEKLKAREKTKHPCFNKAEDDRFDDWRVIEPADVIIVEGWCWGALPQGDDELVTPINSLERQGDVDRAWRREVNNALKSIDYQRAFDNDLQVFLAVPDMESVFRWRLQQESGLPSGSSIMNETEIRAFIMYYERITRSMLRSCPGSADLTILLDAAHKVGSLLNQPPN
jgi:D-glycerate 3-kinase